MKRRFKLLLFLVLIPLLCLGSARIIRGTMQDEWVKAVTAKTSAKSAQVRPLAEMCTVPEMRSALSQPCTTLSAVGLIEIGDWTALGVGLLLPALIAIAGRVARNRRELLWRLFKPALRMTLIGTALIVFLQAVTFGASAWYFSNWVLGGMNSLVAFTIITVVVGALFGLSEMARALLGAMKQPEGRQHAWVLTREDEPLLWGFVDRLAKEVDTLPPQQILLGLQPTFYVTESPLRAQEQSLTGRTLYLSLPFCHVLTEPELGAIIGHELAHFQGEDTLFSRRFYPIYRNAHTSFIALNRARGRGFRQGLALMPAVYLLAYFLDSFATAENEISRTREFAADAAGARLTSTPAMGSALVKVHAFVPKWEEVWAEIVTGLKQGAPVANASHLYTETINKAARPRTLEGLDEKQQPHPVDSHPPLSQRLSALDLALEHLTEAALLVEPESPAIHLIQGAAAIEEGLTEEINKNLVTSGRVQPGTASASA